MIGLVFLNIYNVVRGLFLCLLVTILIIMGIGYWVVASDSGGRWLLENLVPQWVEGLQIEGVSGHIISDLNIDHLVFQNCDLGVEINNVKLVWKYLALKHKTLEIDQLHAEQVDVSQLECATAAPKAEFELPEQIDLPISIVIDSLEIETFALSLKGQTHQIEDLAVTAALADQSLDIDLERIRYLEYETALSIHAELINPFPLKVEGDWRGLISTQHYAGSLKAAGDANQIDLDHQLSTPFQIVSAVEVKDPLASEITFNSTHQWTDVVYEMPDSRKIFSPSGLANFSGNPDDINIEVDTRLDVDDIEKITVFGAANLKGESLMVSQLMVSQGDMNLHGSGQVDLGDSLNAVVTINGEHVNPELVVPGYPGDLRLELDLSAEGIGKENNINLKIHSLDGSLRGYPLYGTGELSSNGGDAVVRDATISVGDNDLKASGTLGDQVDIVASVNARDIGQFLPDAFGDLVGEITLTGLKDNPSVVARVVSDELQYLEKLQIKGSTANVNIAGLKDQNAEIVILSDSVTLSGQELSELDVGLSGSLEQHSLSFDFHSSYGKLAATFEAKLDLEANQWQGKIANLDLGDTEVGDWQSQGIAAFALSATEQKINNLCLNQGAQSLCLNYINDDTRNELDAEIEAFDLQFFAPALGDSLKIAGDVYATAELQTNEENEWVGEIDLRGEDVELNSTVASGIDEKVEFQDLAGTVIIDRISTIDLSFVTNRGKGFLDGQLRDWQKPDQAYLESMSLDVDIPDLGFLKSYVSALELAGGSASIDLKASGFLRNPQMSGFAKAEDIEFTVPQTNIKYRLDHLDISADSISEFDIQGKLLSGDGELDIDGAFTFKQNQGIEYAFDLEGSDLPVMKTSEIDIAISPDLNVLGSASEVNLTGDLSVSELAILRESLPEGIETVSSDEVLVNQELLEPSNKVDKFSMLADINVVLEQGAHFTGYGVDTDLAGKVNVSMDGSDILLGSGALSMVNATYTAFGQTLDVAKGDIIFAGPVSDPALDFRVERRSDDTEVAMLITGKPTDPGTRLISTPSMSEANKLSFLITGKQVEELDSSQGSNLTAAALSLGISQTSPIFDQLGATFGLDTVSIGNNENGIESTSLLLGKKISPNLSVSYAKDLFSDLGAFQVDYRLTDNISLEAESGAVQTIDLIYSIRR